MSDVDSRKFLRDKPMKDSQKTDGSPRQVHFGPYRADLRTEELWKDGVRLKLAGQPFQVLVMLLSRPGDLVTREELQRRLWSADIFSDSNHGLNAAVNKLRETLNDTASNPKYIETLPRRGYRFIGTIESVPEPVPQQADSTPVPEVARARRIVEPSHSVLAKSKPAAHFFRNSVFAAASVVVLLLMIGLVMKKADGNERQADRKEIAAQQEVKAPDEVEAGQPRTTKAPTHRSVASEPSAVPIPAIYREPSTAEAGPTMKTIISDEGGNAAPQFSPDGKRIAFMSNRSGPWQIWVSDVDGGNPVQLSFTDSAGTPRWSPDGGTIAFDAPSDGGTSVFLVASDGRGSARRLVNGKVPSFSRDGRWIYYASDRENGSQIWRIPVEGGPEQQMTFNGGFAGLESSDGYLYYSKSPDHNPEICRLPLSGGEENCGLSQLRPRTWSSWAVTRNGILFASDLRNGASTLSFYEPEKRQVRELLWLPSPPVWMGVSRDGSKAIVNDTAEQRISVVENLR